MTRTLLLATVALAAAQPLIAAPSKHASSAATLSASNPFAKPSTLPYQTPDYGHIKDSDYLPAFLAGMAQNKREIDAIANQKAAPTFDNTLGALENSGLMLERVALTFSAVAGANTNDTLDAVDTKTAPLLAQNRDYINLNKKLFARVKSLHDRQASLHLNPEQAKLLDVYYQGFVHAGAELDPAKQVELKKLNSRISTLESAFGQKLTAATKAGALHVTDKAALAGLSEAEITAAAQAAKDRKLDGYVLPMQNTTEQPAMGSLTNRATREALFNASWMRSEKGDANDTRPVVAELASLRAKKAALMGYPNWASYAMYDQMAKTPGTAKAFLARLAPAVAAKEKAEAADIQALIDKQGGNFKTKPWDWDIYAEQVRKERYALDNESLKPYFEINKVLEDGVFYAANQLYGVTFKERKDIPTWNPDMRAFEVHEENGKLIGLMMFDYWKRDNKQGGAWMSNLVNQSYLRKTIPVI
ncbi:MAG: M3 family metallopeptidase, partial [Sphingomicrobium sp.]